MNPTWVSIIRAPAPIPRFSAGTAPMTALVFGEANRPEPAPTMSCHSASCQIGVSTEIVSASPARPTPVTSIPAVASVREPDRSASAPLIGDRTSSPIASGREQDPGRDRVEAAHALEVEHEQEQDAVPGDPVQQARQVAHREEAVPEQPEIEERVPAVALDQQEQRAARRGTSRSRR